MISGRTALYGVMGWPVGHSLSPVMQNAAFAAAGVDAAYVALPVAPDRLPDAIRGAHALGFMGLNVTVPHKQRAAALCVSLDRVAEEIGAVNTLRRATDGYEGFNTDAPACLALMEAAGVRRGARALLLGAGGAARAAAWALLKLGTEVRVAARRTESAHELCQQLLSALPEVGPRAKVSGWGDVPVASGEADVIVNSTPIGLSGQRERLPTLRFGRGQVAIDFVYGDTEFARAAAAAGASLVTGEQILVRQGALAFSLWLGRPAPEAIMSAALGHPPEGGGK